MHNPLNGFSLNHPLFRLLSESPPSYQIRMADELVGIQNIRSIVQKNGLKSEIISYTGVGELVWRVEPGEIREIVREGFKRPRQ